MASSTLNLVALIEQVERERECWRMFAVAQEDIDRALRDDFRRQYTKPYQHPGFPFSGEQRRTWRGGPCAPQNISKINRHSFSLGQFEQQRMKAHQMMQEHMELTAREIECWRMFGIQVEWFMDEIIITTP